MTILHYLGMGALFLIGLLFLVLIMATARIASVLDDDDARGL